MGHFIKSIMELFLQGFVCLYWHLSWVNWFISFHRIVSSFRQIIQNAGLILGSYIHQMSVLGLQLFITLESMQLINNNLFLRWWNHSMERNIIVFIGDYVGFLFSCWIIHAHNESWYIQLLGNVWLTQVWMIQQCHSGLPFISKKYMELQFCMMLNELGKFVIVPK